MNKILPLWLVSLIAALLIYSAQSLAETPSTGWLSHEDHPPVSVKLELTGHYEAERNLLPALLHVELDEGWKTYWRSPGEGGIPPTFDWAKSANINDIEWHWPVPSRYSIQGIDTVGYQGSLTFPLMVQLSPDARQANISGTLTMSSCTTVCVLTDYPIDVHVDLDTLTVDSDRAFAFNQATGKVPREYDSNNVKQAIWSDANQRVQLTIERDSGWQNPQLFIHSNDETLADAEFSSPDIQVESNSLTANVDVSHWLDLPDLNGAELIATVSDEKFAAEYKIQLTAGTIANNAPPLWAILLMALAGGLILNIMPCVLPVLGLKVQSLMLSGVQEPKVVRKQFFASSLGIISSFLVIALGLMALRWSGGSVGWGIQFQNPYFIAALVAITWLFALNLMGAFEFKLPSSLSTSAATAGDDSYKGHFLQGMLATFLATPCTAPFLGTAVAFALAAESSVILLIFAALGVGMALPWLLIAVFPRTAKLLPKPGRWMQWVKPIFATMMLATTVWLTTLLKNFISNEVFLALTVGLSVLTLVIIGKVHGRKALILSIGGFLVLAAIVGTTLILTADRWVNKLPQDHHWQPLTQQRIDEAVASGQTVFVDVTADWCVTCQANKVGVLLQDPVFTALGQEHVTRLRGDWTKANERITQYLKANNTFGVPFNKVYGPGAPDGITLPVVLSKDKVMDALEDAREQ
ncbi:suppressor for copper-sensitivity B [Idiomarina loihiensis]|uniref:protein-disulfide reductase DsbD family protein n=1 Tax=Idiomarina TaxID=135575 RepID=UPI000D71C0AB|nr:MULTISPECIES: protein-disulfide reductase DsbD domain-containing protein [Idiomarina]PWW40484.1 suppressor for copper-sensitivity B [Idiomarina loihiensis]TDP50175.1 suppressor for copper-sensitivity B [Idiomarina loihiensis]TDS24473.1 suppressor for copper-sensitivity B [Idiomarina sp. H2]